jgi:hypothetical protein
MVDAISEGSENGMPSSKRSTPADSRACAISSVASGEGSPAVIYDKSALSFGARSLNRREIRPTFVL